jgi:transketolase
MTGDGELQEGQNYEALRGAAHHRLSDLIVIVDHNELQTDRRTARIMDLGDMPGLVGSLGWHVVRFDGHDFRAIERALAEAARVVDRPKFLIADTVKGKGVSFMEPSPESSGDTYAWHSGAPDDTSFERAVEELRNRIASFCREIGIAPIADQEVEPQPPTATAGNKVYVADAYGQALLELAQRHPELVVLDGDLAADCRVRAFEDRYPERFIENGIAEQDMVSMAGGLARQGLLPVVNSFASFLAARANEQIYNNATENAKIVYALHFAGLIPAGPGKSHQSVRDISLFGALPNCTIIQPGTPEETRRALTYCVEHASGVCALRLAIGPSPRDIPLPPDYELAEGRGTVLAEGDDAVLFAYGPVMLHEALGAAEILHAADINVRVVNMPWLNRIDTAWLEAVVDSCPSIFVLDDHGPVGGLGDRMARVLAASGQLASRWFETFAVEGYPACGTPGEVLRHHRLDAASLAERIMNADTGTIVPAVSEAAYSAEAPQ